MFNDYLVSKYDLVTNEHEEGCTGQDDYYTPCAHVQWLSFGDVAPMAAQVKAAGIKLMIQVQSVEEAVRAVSLGADAIVAQVC